MKKQQIMSGKALLMQPDEIIVTKTDLKGKITYGNRTFFKFAGYSRAEVIGHQHNIVRHPEMPRSVFKLLWDTISSGEEIFAYVNNRSKNGDHYWVLAHVTPSLLSSGEIDGYHSNRRAPDKKVISDKVMPLYAELLKIENSDQGPKEGMNKAVAHVSEILRDTGMSFNELMFSWGV